MRIPLRMVAGSYAAEEGRGRGGKEGDGCAPAESDGDISEGVAVRCGDLWDEG